MELPIKFPSDAEVIREEARRFRALSPLDRLRSIHGMIAAGKLMIRNSPKSEFIRKYVQQQEELARTAVREFIERHGG